MATMSRMSGVVGGPATVPSFRVTERTPTDPLYWYWKLASAL